MGGGIIAVTREEGEWGGSESRVKGKGAFMQILIPDSVFPIDSLVEKNITFGRR